MPEGPSIVILKEEIQLFKGQKVITVSGNAKQDLKRIQGKTLVEIKTWGKQLLLCYKGFYVRIHLLLFGSYRVNEQREMPVRLSLKFKNGELNFYNASVKIIEGTPDDNYDWEVDTMSDKWNPKKALIALKSMDNVMVCDALLDQNVFAGSGNIIKNEVLFKIYLHPESLVGAITLAEKKNLIKTLRAYCFDFYHWKKAYVLRAHWQIYRARTCPRCNIPVKVMKLGRTQRRTFFCTSCQKLKANNVNHK